MTFSCMFVIALLIFILQDSLLSFLLLIFLYVGFLLVLLFLNTRAKSSLGEMGLLAYVS